MVAKHIFENVMRFYEYVVLNGDRRAEADQVSVDPARSADLASFWRALC